MTVAGAEAGADERASRRRALVGLAAIVAVAAVLRWPGLFGGPGYGSRDELMYVPKAIRYGGGDLNPHYFQNPPLASYLMFCAQGVLYAAGRIAGTFASPLDFKAQYFADATNAFVASRCVSFVLGLGAVAATFVLARRLVPATLSARRRDAAGALAAGLLALSPLHTERSATATNESLVVLVYTLTTIASLSLLRRGTVRAACIAGLLSGIAAGSKYTGGVICAAVGYAALLVADATHRDRLKLLAVAAASSIAGFVLVCPWILLDRATFVSHLANLGESRDRMPDVPFLDALVRSEMTYLRTLWSDGLGPVGAVVAAIGVGAAALGAFAALRGGGGVPGEDVQRVQERRATLVVLAAILPLACVLVYHTRMAVGRYLMPAYPALLALGAAAIVAAPGSVGTWLRRAAAAGAVAWAAVVVSDMPARVGFARAEDTQARLAAWMHGHVPDGAIVICDWYAPRLPPIDARREFEGRVPAATLERLRPSYRVVTAFDYFALPINSVDGVPVDDFPRLAALGDVYVIASASGPAVYDALPPGDYPGRAWYRAVAERLPIVREESPGPGVRGPVLRLHRVQ